MPPPPPPPGPGPPPPPVLSAPKKSGGSDLGALLSDIHKGARLKKTVTNDRSAPAVVGKSILNVFLTFALHVRALISFF